MVNHVLAVLCSEPTSESLLSPPTATLPHKGRGSKNCPPIKGEGSKKSRPHLWGKFGWGGGTVVLNGFRNSSLAILVLALAGVAAEPAPTETLTIRFVRPDRQLEALIGLFDGARAPNPAAALAAWKRATHGAPGLGKPLEALIAALNPGMVRELRGLDGTSLGLGLDPTDGHLRWYAALPDPEGGVAAWTTALCLTDGGSDRPLGAIAVDRLGPPGSPLAARLPEGLVALAGTRSDLAHAIRQAPRGGAPASVASGSLFHLDPAALPAAGPVDRRRLVEALRGFGLRDLVGSLALEGETVELALTGRLEIAPTSGPVDRAWLDWIPLDRTAAAVAVALDPSPAAWDRAFAWADRIARADPGQAQAAPLRTRLNLVAAAARVRPERDVWPLLRGISACVLTDPAGRVTGALVALHADGPPAATRLAAAVSGLAAAFLKGQPQAEKKQAAPPGSVNRLGWLSGRPVEAIGRGSTVLVGWGEGAVASALAAHEDPERSAGRAIRAAWEGDEPAPGRAGVLWPGRLGNALLAGAPPLTWVGRNDRETTRDVVRATGLRGTVRRFLDRLPMDPPPHR